MLILITLIFAVVAGGTFAIAAERIENKRRRNEKEFQKYLIQNIEPKEIEWHEDF